jgi:cytochrome c oxidase subunit 2
MLENYLEEASSYAGDVDRLIFWITVMVGFWFLVAEGLLIGFILRFSVRTGAKAQYISGELPHEKRWVSFPHYAVLLFDVAIIIMAINVWQKVKITMPEPQETVRIIAQQWAWTFQHAGPDNVLDTADDIRTVDELHLLSGRTYHFELQSRDVLHSLSIPVFRVKQDAIPGRTIKGWFKPIMTGTFDLQCTEICGIGHGLMPARVIIEDAISHAEWMRNTAPLAAAAPAAPAPAAPAPTPAVPAPSPAPPPAPGGK